MKTTIRTVLLTMILSGVAQAQVERNGWKLVYVDYGGKEKDGDPVVAFFVKDDPGKTGEKHPKLLLKTLWPDLSGIGSEPHPTTTMSLLEFDCNRGLYREVKTFLTDGTEKNLDPWERRKWNDILDEDDMFKAMLKYACRSRTDLKK